MVPTGSPEIPTVTTADRDELLARARRGERVAVEKLLSSVAPSVHRFSLRMCKNAHDAEDVLQDTLLTVAQHLDDFEGRSSLTSWVFSITRSVCARRRRGVKNRPSLGEEHIGDQPALSPTPEASASNQELASALTRALDSLSEEHREVILLRDVEGLSAPEAAAALSVSVDALKSRLHRARAALRVALHPVLEASVAPSTGMCPDIVALWSNKLEGDLSQRDCSVMEQHMLGCQSCTKACDALKQALSACRGMTGNVSPAVQARVKAAMHDWTQLAAL